ncbi:MAG: lysophospholipid acyltransferase family protein [Phycisphaerales bacterium]|nr:lysophospholipid acyltransferase family protein [Phycisphaerales bacterium]
MPRNRSVLRNWAEYLPARAIASLLQCFPVEQNLATAAWGGRMYYRLSAKRRLRAICNIQDAFPDWSRECCDDVARRSVENMFQLAGVDALAMPRLVTPDRWPEFVDLGDAQHQVRRMMGDRSTLFITGHCGNWEMLGYSISVVGYPMAALARPLDNPLLNGWLLGLRQAYGLRILTKWGATPEMQKIIKANEPIGFIADQNAGDNGIFVPFFGRLASTYKSIGLLAMKYELPLVVTMAERINGGFKYRINVQDVIEPEEWADQPDPLYYITARYIHGIEQMVRRAPEQYLWMHRRWKSRPRHERQGQDMPQMLEEQIRSLPWLSTDECEAVIDRSNQESKLNRKTAQ